MLIRRRCHDYHKLCSCLCFVFRCCYLCFLAFVCYLPQCGSKVTHAFFLLLGEALPHGARAGLAPRLRFQAIGHHLSFPSISGERGKGVYLLEQHGALHKRQHRNISRLVKGRVHARAQMVGITSTLLATKRIAGEASSRMARGVLTRPRFLW